MTKHPIALAIALTFATSAALSGCDPTAHLTEQEHIQRAKDFEDKGEINKGIIELKNAVQKNPNSAEARLMLGLLYIKDMQSEAAEKELLRARELGVGEESVKIPLGEALLLQEHYARVLDEVIPKSQTSPQNLAKILQLRGQAQLGLGHSEQGCELFKQSAQTDPAYVPAYWGLARCAAATKDFDHAKALLEQALKLDAKNVDTWMWLGKLEQTRNDLKAAESAYSSVLKIAPNHVGAHLSLASLRLSAGEFDSAQAEIDAARKIAPNNPRVNQLRATLAFQQGKYAVARDTLQALLKVAPNYMPSVLLSGLVAYELGNYEQANKDLAKVLTQFPNSVHARKGLAAALLKTEQPDRALEVLRPLLLAENQDATVLAMAGEASMQAHKPQQARDYLQKAEALNPKNAALRTALSVSLMAAGDSARAIAELESITVEDTTQSVADTLLIEIYLRQGQFDKVLKAVAVLEKKAPNNPRVFNFRGAANLGKKDFASARKDFEKALAIDPDYSFAAMNLAQIDLLDNNPQAARKRYEAILAKEKNNLPALLQLAKLASDKKETASLLERAIQSHPTAMLPRRLLVEHYLHNNEMQTALGVAREAQASNPRSADALDLLGSTQRAAGARENAITSYQQLVRLVPESPLAHFKLASAQIAAKDYSAAIASLNTALKLKPDYLDAQAALISLDVKMGKHAEALKIAQGIQKQDPKSPAGFLLEGEIMAARKRYAEAVKSYEKALELGKNSLLAIKIHQAQSLAGDAKKADTGLLHWLKDQPDDLVARSYLAQTYMKAGKSQLAIEQNQAILKKDPNNLSALNNLALLYQQEKDPRALATAEQAYKLRPDAASIGDTLGWILVERGETARGLDLLQKAAATAPKNPEISYHYAAALAKTGDKAKARKQLEEVLARGQDFPQKAQATMLLKQVQ